MAALMSPWHRTINHDVRERAAPGAMPARQNSGNVGGETGWRWPRQLVAHGDQLHFNLKLPGGRCGVPSAQTALALMHRLTVGPLAEARSWPTPEA